MYGLTHTADVYTPAEDDGDFTVLATSGLACRLCHIQHAAADVADERESIGTNRRLLWAASYTMPDTEQVEIDSERWNVRPGTFGAVNGPLGTVTYRRCEVTKAL